MNIKSSKGKNLKLYYSGHADQSIEGVGIIVDEETQCKFNPVSSRVLIVTITNNSIKTNLITAYSPTNETTKNNLEETEN